LQTFVERLLNAKPNLHVEMLQFEMNEKARFVEVFR